MSAFSRTAYTNAKDLISSFKDEEESKNFMVKYIDNSKKAYWTNKEYLTTISITPKDIQQTDDNQWMIPIKDDIRDPTNNQILLLTDSKIELQMNGTLYGAELAIPYSKTLSKSYFKPKSDKISGGKYRLNKKTKRRLSRKQKTKRKLSKNKTRRNI